MAASDGFMSIEEAARSLDVTVQHVRRLADAGELTKVARGLIDRASLDRYVIERQGGRTRVWAEHTAWGAIAMLTGDLATWLGPVQASRLRSALREITDPADLLVRTRARAKAHTFTGHPSAVVRLLEMMAVVDPAAIGVGASVVEPGRAEGYLAANTLDSAVRFLGLRAEPSGNIVVRATTFDFGIVTDLASRSAALAGLDAAASPDPRIRGAGERVLLETLDRYRR
jgi:excisionase family DNA binding protein